MAVKTSSSNTARGTKKAGPKQSRAKKAHAENVAERIDAKGAVDTFHETVNNEHTHFKEQEEKSMENKHDMNNEEKNANAVLEPEFVASEQTEKVCAMFKTITKHYDLLNHICSLGLDFWWRKVLVDGFVLGPTRKILDMAAGTLDVSLYALKKHKQAHIVAGDICPEMLEMGKEKLKAKDTDRIEVKIIDALSIPYAENSFDVVSIAFGIRNIEDKVKALTEMKKVLTVGGQLHVLELSPVKNPLLQKCYYFYLEKIMPQIAKFFGQRAEAYQYLAQSVKAFPDQEAFCEDLKQAGFEFVQYKKLTFGIATLYTAIKSK
ncbi:MAG TPA: bifunctional demethylmenaquinone methyltransferase/2-methoxy-6-polyprenyl-1,4-benzoquinol methylase UbiE [Desulfovibrio sp.]|nr:bifunctional demethylmenaquinone methyltransferase/2-methoxy-6-polyprenyl-1,4-benzoquinol methylase UbiE [Desulfovibrio sp.]